MKNESFVHGNLRTPNIMIRIEEIYSDTPTPIIVDFEWAGTQG